MSQKGLAWFWYNSQRAVPNVKCEQAWINLSDLLTAASTLEKPASYFLPPAFTEGLQDDFTSDERELIHFYRQIADDTHKAIAVQQVRSIVDAERRASLEEQRRGYEAEKSAGWPGDPQ